MSERDFEKLLLQAVDEGLSSLGESAKQAIYFHLEKSFNAKKKKIPFEIEAFVNGIEKIFGLGATFLEVLIVRRLYERVGRVFEWDESTDFTFTECVAVAERSFLEKKRTKKMAGELIRCEETVIEG